MQAMFVYATASSREEALNIGRTLVRERLAACANILDGMTSVYWWEQRVQEAGEATLILKTTSQLVGRLTARISELHSYTCPCVVAHRRTWRPPAGRGLGPDEKSPAVLRLPGFGLRRRVGFSAARASPAAAGPRCW
jgi:periplasmic divalent cation tolerance protein